MNSNHLSKYTVIVLFEAIQGKEEELKNVLKSVIEPSRSEQSCLEYRLHQNVTNPTQFIFYENWENSELHKEHSSKSYIKSLKERVEPLLKKPFEVIGAHELF